MVNQVIVDYLRKYSGMYPLEALKQQIIATGYPSEEVDEAAAALGLKAKPTEPVSGFQALEQKNAYKKGFKWIKTAGIIGVVFLIIGILSSIASIVIPFFYTPENIDPTALLKVSSFLSNPIFIIMIILLIILLPIFAILFYKGFSKMGKFAESKLLVFSSRAFIFLIILFVFLVIGLFVFLFIFGSAIASSLLNANSGGGGLMVGSAINISGVNLGLFGYVLLVSIFLFILFVFLNTILFFIGLINAGKKVKFAKIAGIIGLILFLVSNAFNIFLVFNPLLSAAVISSGFGSFFIGSIFLSLGCLVSLFMVLSLFDASRKFESD